MSASGQLQSDRLAAGDPSMTGMLRNRTGGPLPPAYPLRASCGLMHCKKKEAANFRLCQERIVACTGFRSLDAGGDKDARRNW
jgi:hypothetical protein